MMRMARRKYCEGNEGSERHAQMSAGGSPALSECRHASARIKHQCQRKKWECCPAGCFAFALQALRQGRGPVQAPAGILTQDCARREGTGPTESFFDAITDGTAFAAGFRRMSFPGFMDSICREVPASFRRRLRVLGSSSFSCCPRSEFQRRLFENENDDEDEDDGLTFIRRFGSARLLTSSATNF
jgi:hypothetical protein